MRRSYTFNGRPKQPETRNEPPPVTYDFKVPTTKNLAKSIDPLLDTMLARDASDTLMIPDTKPRLPEIRKEVEALRYASIALQKDIVARVAALHKEHNDLVPFHNKLPLELRVQIIVESLARKDVSTWERSYKRLAQLSTISTSWWSLIKGSPELWTVVDPDNFRQASCAFERSRNAPLHINLNVTVPDPYYGRDFLQRRLDLITPHLHRCQILDVQTLDHDQFHRYIESSAPALRTLRVEVKRPHREVEDLAINLDKAPNVSDLFLHGCLPTWSISSTPPTIKVLTLCSITIPRKTMVALLLQCSNSLEELNLNATNLDHSANSHPLPIVFPFLRKSTLLRLSWKSLEMMENIIQAGSAFKFFKVTTTPPMNRQAVPPDSFLGLNGHNQPSLLATAIQNSQVGELLIVFDFGIDECQRIRGGGIAGKAIGFDISPWRLGWSGVLEVVSRLSLLSTQNMEIVVFVTSTTNLQSIGNRIQELRRPVSLVFGPENMPDDILRLSCPDLEELWITYFNEENVAKEVRKAFDYDPGLLPFADPLAFKIRGRKVTSFPHIL